MSRFLLDTDAFLLLGFGLGEVSLPTRDALAEGQRFVSHVSAIEIAIKHSIGKLPAAAVHDDFGGASTVVERGRTCCPIEMNHIGGT